MCYTLQAGFQDDTRCLDTARTINRFGSQVRGWDAGGTLRLPAFLDLSMLYSESDLRFVAPEQVGKLAARRRREISSSAAADVGLRRPEQPSPAGRARLYLRAQLQRALTT